MIDSKLPHVGTSIFAVMSALAAEHRAINLSQGFPDFAVPDELLEGVSRHLREGRNQYAPMAGVLALREAICAKLLESYGRRIDPEREVTVTSGGTEAIFDAITAMVRPGDEVVVFDPSYDSYGPAIELNGGRAVRLPLLPPRFEVDWDRVAAALTARTRLIIVNSPHNPTGVVWSRRDFDQLARLVEERDLVVLSDEVYEHIVFDGVPHVSVLDHPVLASRSFAVFSFGKTYHATGWKMGYCVAPPELTAEFRKVHQFVTFCSTTPIQHALAEFMVARPDHWRGLPAFYQERRDAFCNGLRGSRLTLVPSSGTYFQLVDYGAITDKQDAQYARELTMTRGLAAIPISAFYERPPQTTLLRFCFAKDAATLDRATEILRGL
ncbi:MAG TPA: methionine aminotransferase [Polyangiaceae bacterium]|nr:methionine aminotransferase [Polyangiaceae bacterium]